MTDLYHQKNDYSMARHMFNDGRNRESMPMPENVHITKMDGQQLQAQTGCLVLLRLCNLAVENELQAKLLDTFEEVIRENGMKEPTWEEMGKAIKAQVNPFELVWHTLEYEDGYFYRSVRIHRLGNCTGCYTAQPVGSRCMECNFFQLPEDDVSIVGHYISATMTSERTS